MKKFYLQLKKIQDMNSVDRNQLVDYIHFQKNEVSNLLSITPEFWVAVDYVIHLTRAILKKPKIEAEKDFKTIIKPLFDSYVSKIERIMRKIPDEEFFFLKKDLKSFHHLICHSINLIDKGLSHFIPSYLFIDSIENMTVMYPLHENCCDHGTLARKNYSVLLSRFISEDFTPYIKKIMNFLIWLQSTLPHMIPEDRTYMRSRMIALMEDAVKDQHKYKFVEKYSTKELVVELREVITESFIREKLISLLDRMKTPGNPVPVADCLEEISSIFIETKKLPDKLNTVRDLKIALDISDSLIKGLIGVNERKEYYESLVDAIALRSYFLKVTRYMIDPVTETDLCKLIETVDFLFNSYPSLSVPDEIIEVLEKSKKSVASEIEKICSEHSIEVNQEGAFLFKSKMRQIYSRN